MGTEIKNEKGETCEHLSFAVEDNGELCIDFVISKDTWHCQVCSLEERGNLCFCLICEYIGCRNEDRKHVVEHFNKIKHPVFYLFDENKCYCYECNSYLKDDHITSFIQKKLEIYCSSLKNGEEKNIKKEKKTRE